MVKVEGPPVVPNKEQEQQAREEGREGGEEEGRQGV